MLQGPALGMHHHPLTRFYTHKHSTTGLAQASAPQTSSLLLQAFVAILAVAALAATACAQVTDTDILQARLSCSPALKCR